VREDCGDGGHSVLQAVEFGRGFPFGVLGPVDLWALRRFASICFWLAMVAPLVKCEKAGAACFWRFPAYSLTVADGSKCFCGFVRCLSAYVIDGVGVEITFKSCQRPTAGARNVLRLELSGYLGAGVSSGSEVRSTLVRRRPSHRSALFGVGKLASPQFRAAQEAPTTLSV
jgi:hypothetical protein